MPLTRILACTTLLAAVAAPATAAAKTITVRPGSSIQAAVDRARAGDTVTLAPGTYRETGRPCPTEHNQSCAVVIERSHVRLVGRRAVLEAAPGQDDGIAVGRTANPSCLRDGSKRLHGSLISGLEVRGFGDDGVLLTCVDHWRITRVRSTGNAEYSFFPEFTVAGRLDHSYASGANDTGFYIGQSRDARVSHNRAVGNVSGFEIENSAGIRTDHNLATHNVVGFFSSLLPRHAVKANEGNEIDHNRAIANDRTTGCVGPTICSALPQTGILLLAADRNRVHDNRVERNPNFGIAVVNYCNARGFTRQQCAALDIDPNPDHNRIESNRASGNGSAPAGPLARLAGDLAWDGMGRGNCFARNVAPKHTPRLPRCR